MLVLEQTFCIGEHYHIKGRDQGLLELTGQTNLPLGGQDIPVTVSSSETRMAGGGVR